MLLLVSVVISAALLSLGAATASASACAAGGALPPSVMTETATQVSTRSATLPGQVNPQGCATTFRFQYGPTTAYGHTTPAQNAGAGTTAVAAAAAITGLTANTTYQFRVEATNGVGTTPGQNLAFTTPTPCVAGSGVAPSVATTTATGAQARGATLNGRVNPHGCATTFRFQYGLTTAYGHTTPAQNAGAGTTAVAAAAAITGLTANTTYQFRVEATNGVGTTPGQNLAFTTPTSCVAGSGVAPSVATTTATGAQARGATLNGRVNPHGCATTFRFQYGLTTAYGDTTPAQNAGAGTTAVAAAAAITGLTANTTYQFRIYAHDVAGKTVGHNETFTTPATPVQHSFVGIVRRGALVRRGYVANVRLGCSQGTVPCEGVLKIFRNHRLIGRRGFVIAAHSRSVVRVRLNQRGRRLIRHHRLLRVEVVARTSVNRARAYELLVRRFPIR